MLLNKTKEDFLELIVNDLANSTNIRNMTPGSVIYTLATAVANAGEDLVTLFNSGVIQSLLANAKDEWLDIIGRGMYVFRRQASFVTAQATDNNVKFYVASGTFGDINGGDPITIPVGTKISTTTSPDGEVTTFIVDTETTLLQSANSVYVNVSASREGPISIATNSLVTHNFSNYKNSVFGTLLVTNSSPIVGGTITETNEEYRYRISNAIYIAQSGNNIAIIASAMSVPGVADVKINNFEQGPGTATIYITPTIAAPVPALIPLVELAIKNFTAIGNKIIVKEPRMIGVELSCRLQFKERLSFVEKVSLKTEAIIALTNYINNLTIGETLYIQKLTSIILDLSNNILRIGEGQTIWDMVNIYRPSYDMNRIQQTPLGDIEVKDFEKIVCEFSIQSPIRVL